MTSRLRNIWLLKLIVVLCLSSIGILAEDNDKPFIYAGASFNPLLISADFYGFEGNTPCCEPYGDNFSFGYGLFLGKEFQVFDNESAFSYDLRLSIENINSSWSDEYFVSHRINGDTFDSLYSNNNFEFSILNLSIRNYFRYEVSDKMKLGAFLDLSVPVSSSSTKSETVARDLPFTFENGEKSRINENQSIEGLSTIIPGIGAALSYEIYRNSSIAVAPEAEFQINFLDLADGADISYSAARVGVSIGFFTSPTVASPPIPPPPVPTPPLPVLKPAIESIQSELFVEDKAVSQGDTLRLVRKIERTLFQYTILPRLFFDKEGNINDHRYENLTPEALSIKDQITNYFGGKATSDLTFRSYYIEGTDFQPEYYLAKVGQELRVRGIPIIIDTLVNDFQYPELLEEYRRVDILNSGVEKPIEISLSLDSTLVLGERYRHKVSVIPDSLANMVTASITDDSRVVPYVIKRDFYSQFPFKDGIAKYTFIMTNSLNDSVIKKDYFVESVEEIEEYQYRVYDLDTKTAKRQYLLGYTRFDESKLFIISESVREIAIQALKDGKKITIIASTDDLGDPVYNRSLANRRAAEAVKLFPGNFRDQVSTMIPKKYVFDNDHPYGRQLNRAILIRIDE